MFGNLAPGGAKVIFAMFLRQWRGGKSGFAVLTACSALCAFCVSAELNFIEGSRDALKRESRALLGGEWEAVARGPFPREARDQAAAFLQGYGTISRTVTFRSMLRAKESAGLLAEVKAVDDAYPLAGEFSLKDGLKRASALTPGAGAEPPGFIADEALSLRTGLTPGDKAWIGSVEFVFRGTLMREPDRATQLFGLGPRVMMSLEALERSQLAAGMTTAEYAFRCVPQDTGSSTKADDAFALKLEQELTAKFPGVSWRVKLAANGAASVKRFLDQFSGFLTLSALASLLAAGAGAGGAARAYALRQAATAGTLRMLGASRATVFWSSASAPLAAALAASALGAVAGAWATVLAEPLARAWAPSLQGLAPGFAATVTAFVSAFSASALFFLPVFASSLRANPGALFRGEPPHGRHTARVSKAMTAAVIVPALCFAAPVAYLAGGPKSLVWLAPLALGGAVYFWGAARCADLLIRRKRVRELQRAAPEALTPFRFALASLCRPGALTHAVMYAAGPAVTIIIALAVTEGNFRHRLEETVNAVAPDLFLMDVREEALEPLRALLETYAAGKQDVQFAPVIRARISELNGRPLREKDVDPDVRWALRGDRMAAFYGAPPEGVRLTRGRWWSDDAGTKAEKGKVGGAAYVCPDEALLRGAGIKIGDVLTLTVLGAPLKAQVTCGRDVDYSSFRMNFALILSESARGSMPVTYLGTARLAERGAAGEAALMRRLAVDFPETSVVRVRETAELVKRALSAVMQSLRWVALFGMAAGGAALLGALAAGAESRVFLAAVLKMSGARRAWTLQAFAWEWGLCALAAAAAGLAAGEALAWGVISRFPGGGFSPMPGTALAAAAGAPALVTAAGYLMNRGVFGVRCARLLRQH